MSTGQRRLPTAANASGLCKRLQTQHAKTKLCVHTGSSRCVWVLVRTGGWISGRSCRWCPNYVTMRGFESCVGPSVVVLQLSPTVRGRARGE